MNRTPDPRAGFALIEALVTMMIVSIIGASLVGLLVSQSTFTNHQDALRNARAAAYGAVNVLTSELRMVERAGGFVSADSQSIEVRIPVTFGLSCGTVNDVTTLSLLPTDSATLAEAALSGYAVRDGGYTYTDTLSVAAGTSSVCAADSISTVAGGRVVDVTPPSTAAVGTAMFLFQTVRYEFRESAVLPGRMALWRTAVTSGDTEEISSPLDSASVFRFIVADADSAQATAPVDLADLVGLEFRLIGESELPAKGETAPVEFPLDASVRFMNRVRSES